VARREQVNAWKPEDDELTALRAGAPYVWGKIVRFHDVGRYTLVEYVGKDAAGREVTRFSVYVDGRATHRSSGSLDRALVCALAIGHLEINEAGHMTGAACKILGVG
jgi:hypothetical protein